MRRSPSLLLRPSLIVLSTLATSLASLSAQTSGPHLKTRWAADVDTAHPLSEYPRPQMVRAHWQNLNGWWDYAVRDSASPRPAAWDGRILVPFPIESQISRVGRSVSEVQRLWYHTTFRAEAPAGGRLLLHFEAVDWQADVYVNDHLVGTHRGGYDPFTFDVTDALVPGSEQELVVRVWDPTDAGGQPRGKQVRRPHGIWYTSVTGIWQTVWLEPVPDAHIADLVIEPDVDSSRVSVRVVGTAEAGDASVRAEVMSGGRVIASARKTSGTLVLPVPHPHLWSPDDPFLYDLRVSLGPDTITSYFGMRKIAVAPDSTGTLRLFLNNQPLFEFGPLDQGWWPGGLYTAPTDDALRADVATMRKLGFNMARKHVKVEPARWYYWTDKLGLLVWQDMPSGANHGPAERAEFESELRRIVDARRNHPSIVMWVPFNEGWGQYDTERIAHWLKSYDPSRLVDNASGWTDRGVGDVVDVHAYPGPAIPPDDGRRARVLGEFGGLGLPLEGHTWLDRDNWGYRSFTDTASLGRAYHELLRQVRYLESEGLAAAVYTQLTDVEVEVNGVMTYDRAVVKLPGDARAAAERFYGRLPLVRGVVPTSRGEGQAWRYTTTEPSAGWSRPGFDDSTWREGLGGFGRTRSDGTHVRTVWTSPDLWLRRTFVLAGDTLSGLHLLVRHDDDVDIYIDGVRAGSLEGANQAYEIVPISPEARRLLRRGVHTLSVHVHNTRGAQYVDVGIVDVSDR